MGRFLQSLVSILYPPVCPMCGRVVQSTGGRSVACRDCRRSLMYVGPNHCMKCGKPLDEENGELCFDCEKTRHVYDQGAAVFQYSQGIKQSIYRFKYNGCRDFADWYGEEMYRICQEQLKLWTPQVIIPVPLHVSKERIRGYNQAELIAVELGKRSGIRVDSNILKRSRATTPMKSLNDQQRSENVEKAFTIYQNSIKYKKVVLVDDIYTTGSTIDACARVLKKAGVDKVYCLSLCVGKGI